MEHDSHGLCKLIQTFAGMSYIHDSLIRVGDAIVKRNTHYDDVKTLFDGHQRRITLIPEHRLNKIERYVDKCTMFKT